MVFIWFSTLIPLFLNVTRYSFNISPRLEESVVLFYLYRSANIVKAYETAVKIVSDLIEKKVTRHWSGRREEVRRR